jgi:hypothetical protein
MCPDPESAVVAVRMQKCRLVLESRNLNGMVTIFGMFSN